MYYTPLHVHSDGSLIDGLSQVSHLIQRAKEIGCPYVTITDHGSLINSVKQHTECKKAGLTPIIGIELYLCNLPSSIKDSSNKKLYHLVCLAKNKKGWQELLKLSKLTADGFYFKPRISLDELIEQGFENLIFIDGHLGSILSQYLVSNDEFIDANGSPVKHIKKCKKAFGDNYCLEVQYFDQEHTVANKLSDMVRDLGRKTKTMVVAGTDAHYTWKAQAETHRVLLSKSLNMPISAARSKGVMACFFNTDNYYIPSYEEMIGYGYTEEELEATNKISSQVEEYEILSDVKFPTYNKKKSGFEEYKKKVYVGYEKKKGKLDQKRLGEYEARLELELEIIKKYDIADYFLIVADTLDWIEENGGMRSVGRGSSGGVLSAYFAGIVGVDAIKYDLLFERFIDESRLQAKTPPDIDVDVPTGMRDSIIQYLEDKYVNTAQVATFTTLQGRGSLEIALKAYGATFQFCKSLTKMIPDEAKLSNELEDMAEQGLPPSSLLYSLIHNPNDWKDHCEYSNGEYSGPMADQFRIAVELQGTKIAMSKHAAAIAMSDSPLDTIVPMLYDTKTERAICGVEYPYVEALGIMKLDLLGLDFLDSMMNVKHVLKYGELPCEA